MGPKVLHESRTVIRYEEGKQILDGEPGALEEETDPQEGLLDKGNRNSRKWGSDGVIGFSKMKVTWEEGNSSLEVRAPRGG